MTMTNTDLARNLKTLATKLSEIKKPVQDEVLRDNFKTTSEGRWTAKNKLALLISLSRQQISVEDITDKYQSSTEEVRTWIDCLSPAREGYGLKTRTIIETRQPR